MAIHCAFGMFDRDEDILSQPHVIWDYKTERFLLLECAD